MTDRVVGDVVRSYTTRERIWPFHYEVGPAGDAACDVRFGTATSGSKEAVMAHDGVVVVVNPLNPITRITMSQLRDVMTGRIVDWSQLGGRSGAILAVLPNDGSDEARILAETVMQRQNPGEHVMHAVSTAELVRSVTAPSGIRSIGISSFSGSSPAKVIAFEVAPPPSPLSIAANRYPMSVRIICESDFRSPSKAAAGLIAFALSNEGQRLVARTGLLSRDGF